ncbi:MAG: glucose-1-phosphate adenylyltransferase [Dehalococcoidia bacterium]|nr:glucose-1-phosphate adenylyltransferase [Dehalococcoidia bacterium]
MPAAALNYHARLLDTVQRSVALILAGGQGKRLRPLTERRAKPALFFGGSYRVVDFALSNCANSGLSRVGVLTQYLPHELHEHLGGGTPWGFHAPGAALMVLQPYMGDDASRWYEGSADAVHRNLDRLVLPSTAAVVILASDQIYAMDYREMIATHVEADADITVSVADVPLHDASRYGLVTMDATGRVRRFEEKPARPRSTLASMGIYVFNPDYLARTLAADAADETSTHDFGGDVLPRAIAGGARVYAHRFRGYWRDIGTVEAYWKTHMELLDEPSRVPLRAPGREIMTRMDPRPPAAIASSASVQQALVSAGATIRGTVRSSVVSPGVVVEPGAVVHDSVLLPGVRVGAGAIVHRAVIDQDAVIGSAARIGADWYDASEHTEHELGVTVVGEGSWIPAGGIVEPSDVVAPFSGRGAAPPRISASGAEAAGASAWRGLSRGPLTALRP